MHEIHFSFVGHACSVWSPFRASKPKRRWLILGNLHSKAPPQLGCVATCDDPRLACAFSRHLMSGLLGHRQPAPNQVVWKAPFVDVWHEVRKLARPASHDVVHGRYLSVRLTHHPFRGVRTCRAYNRTALKNPLHMASWPTLSGCRNALCRSL